ncbi:uncharacterized protein LOC143747549 isoform X3 [Siphateles boraxobius]
MAIRVVLFLTLFTGLCVTDSQGNLALNGMAVQSSLGHPQGDAQHAIDGNRDSDYKKESCTFTKTEFNPWWRVDLGNVYSVSNVTITNRGDCCKERLRGAQIRIGNKLDNNGNNNELVATILTPPNGTETFSFESVNGRYVNIFLPGNDEILTLCEVEVFAVMDTPSYICGPRNLALGAPAVQSSNQGTAQKAVDGNRNSNYNLGSCSATNADRDPWWRVDLLAVYGVTRVSITNRGDAVAERINGAQIRIGNSLVNNGNNNELAATVVSIPAGVTKTFKFKPINGRYVNIFIPGRNKYLTLCEVEVFAGNLAVGATAVQSTTYGGGEAQRAVDGNRDSDWGHGSCSHTNGDRDPWWRVDLGKVYKVTRVSISNCGDAVAERINGAQIRIGNSLENNGNNNELAATVESIPAGVTKTFEFKPINGRYVNIIIPGRNEYLVLCEVEVFGDTSTHALVPRNLAVGATAVQSSTYGGGEAQRAVDGNRDSDWGHGSCSHTNGDRDPWWRVDLLEVYKVTRVSITNRGDAVAERINGAEIRIGNSLDNNGNNNELAATVVSIPAGETKTFEFKPIKGRYVNVYIPGRNEYLTLCEVEVFAEKYTPTYTGFPTLHGIAPTYIADLIQLNKPKRAFRSESLNLLVVPRTHRRMRGDRSFAAAATRLWNTLPHYIRERSSLTEFKRHLKTYFYILAFDRS